MSFDRVPVIRITHGPSPAPTKMCSVPPGLWKKSHGRRIRSVPLDEQPALAGQNEERLLLRLGVVEAGRLAGLKDVEPEAELRERELGALEAAQGAARFPGEPPRVP